MKLSPGEQEKVKLFGPSKFSGEGFLGDDRRHPDEIIDADRQAVERLGMSCEHIAGRLESVFDRAEAALGDPVELQPGITATFFEARGKVPSPFRGDGVFQKGEVAVSDEKTGITFYITRLGIHLIRKHCFFQGKGSRYRIEPEEAVRLSAPAT
jgi:hypothetical protein